MRDGIVQQSSYSLQQMSLVHNQLTKKTGFHRLSSKILAKTQIHQSYSMRDARGTNIESRTTD